VLPCKEFILKVYLLIVVSGDALLEVEGFATLDVWRANFRVGDGDPATRLDDGFFGLDLLFEEGELF
jgi:hypothetical protein